MAYIYNWVELTDILEDYLDLSAQEDDYDEDRILKYMDDVAAKVLVRGYFDYRIKLQPIEGYTAKLPKGTRGIVQMACREDMDKKVTMEEIVEVSQKAICGDGDCEYVITKKCNSCKQNPCACGEPEIIIDFDRIASLNRPQYQYKHMEHLYNWGGLGNERGKISSVYNNRFYLMKPAVHNFHAADYHIPGCLNLNQALIADNVPEYSIDMDKIITNIKQGEILISYFSDRLGEDGYRKIPDQPDVIEALTWGVEEKMMYRKVKMGASNMFTLYQNARAEKVAAIGRAREKLDSPSYDEWMTFLDTTWRQIIPRQNPQNQANRHITDQYNPPKR